MKVVINNCYGGFSISLAAAELMAERGNKQALAEVGEYTQEKLNNLNPRFHGFGYVQEKGAPYNDDGYDRTDVDLIFAVEVLGDKAGGECAELKVVEIPDGTDYTIDDYDGMETIHEAHLSWG